MKKVKILESLLTMYGNDAVKILQVWKHCVTTARAAQKNRETRRNLFKQIEELRLEYEKIQETCCHAAIVFRYPWACKKCRICGKRFKL